MEKNNLVNYQRLARLSQLIPCHGRLFFSGQVRKHGEDHQGPGEGGKGIGQGAMSQGFWDGISWDYHGNI